MRIRIHGRNRKVERKELRYAIKWMCQQLMPELHEDLFIELHMKRLQDDNAWMAPIEHTQVLRAFRVILDTSLPRHRQLTYLAHELVHVKQYAKGEMRDRYVQVRSPRGVKYKLKDVRFKKRFIDPVLVEYNKQPWEVEARRLQGKLYKDYRDHLKSIDTVFLRA